jgi:hypothetical protein
VYAMYFYASFQTRLFLTCGLFEQARTFDS